MSKSGWIIAATLGIAALALIGIGVFYSYDSFSRYQQDHASQRGEVAQNQTSAASKGIEFCRTSLSQDGVFAWFECVVKSVTANSEDKQSQYDLKAQQDMAAWAYGMFIATLWIAGITLVGVLFVGWTLIATRRMAIDTREFGVAQTRPWLSLKLEVGSDLAFKDDGGRIAIIATLVNHGHSPAIAVDVHFASTAAIEREMTVLEETRARPFIASQKRSRFGHRIFPQEPHRHRAKITIPISREGFERGMISPVVVCSVRYQTPGDPQSQHFTDVAMSLVDTESGMGLGMSTKVKAIPQNRLKLEQHGLGAVQ